ncbi:transmembrane protein 26 isoform X2 [Leptopilina heterotoma]|nr:transmembrane protein 26 isoform X2 [Leptopilina heterotoma]XP_043466164.1 transmembrane protein 26 isoform X2 [Leptopilina heterotoma]
MRESNINISESLDFTNLAASDLKHLEKALGVNIKLPTIQISTETWVTLIEQFLMLILIIGRWMLPKGDLTRDQLSQLLLVYIGTAADIIEFFDSFKEDKIAREPVLVYLTLGIWSWSLMQFTVVLTATKSRKSRLSSGSAVKRKVPTETSCCSIDVWGIAINMLLQDGPFLSFRLILIIHYQIVSYMNIFFTCKNTLVILLQLYRLHVVQTETKSRRKQEKYEKYEIPNISIIYRNEKNKEGRNKRYREDKRKRKLREIDVEENISDSDYSENIDKYDSSPKTRSRKPKEDSGYSNSSSRNSRKSDDYKKRQRKRKSSRKEEVKCESFSENDEKLKKKRDRSDKKEKKKSRENKKAKHISEEESSSEDFDESKTETEESDSNSDDRKIQKHGKRRSNRV